MLISLLTADIPACDLSDDYNCKIIKRTARKIEISRGFLLEYAQSGGDSLNKDNDRFVFSRKELKYNARTNFKHHYLMYVVACLMALFVQAEFLTSDTLISIRRQVIADATESVYELTGVQNVKRLGSVYIEIDEDADSLYNGVEQALYNKSFENEKVNEVFGRTRGSLNQLINYVTQDTIISNIYSVITQFSGSESAAQIIISAAVLLLSGLAWLYVRNVYIAASRRIFLEGRTYKKVPFSRYLYFIRVKRWTRASLVMALKTILELFGMMTIVLFPVIHCGLILVPYIIAENPDVRPVEALRLSWRMMNGNKMKVFKLFMSFIGWYILGFITLGASNILYSNPYVVCCYTEFYSRIRRYSKEKKLEGTELLNDEYLFARADSDMLEERYSDVLEELEKPEYAIEGLEGRREKFFAKNLGVVLSNSNDEIEYENHEARKMKMLAHKNEALGLVYPSRLSPIPDQRKIPSLENIHYLRHYSVLSLVMLFFIFSNFGWTWELLYYFLMKGKLINRGFLHGPWLPIYGFGGLFVLTLLARVRKRPFIFFISAILLCGTVEYLTGWVLEEVFGSQWWNYDGYFLNLHGRICAEGLFVFGVCALAFIYVLAPLLDSLIRKINRRILLPIAVILLIILAADFVYSNLVPNTGYGITGSFDKDEDPVPVETVIEDTV